MVEPRKFEPRKTLFVALVLIGLYVFSLKRDAPGPPHISFQGATMGTTYSVKVAHSTLSVQEAEALHDQIQLRLNELNRQMSTYLPESEISAVNQAQAGASIEVSSDFAKVVRLAKETGARTGGAFDITLKPLIDLWGFGPERGKPQPPSEEEIKIAAEKMGYEQVQIPSHNQIALAKPDMEINLDGIAKGYAVDAVAEMIKAAGQENLFVEIGGEIMATGLNPSNRTWRIGIEQPKRGSTPGSQLGGIAEVSGFAVATSGDYRNYFQGEDGTYYTHIIDPRTKRPVRHQLAGVTVLAATCAIADALATALFVMGEKDGAAWTEQQEDIEALFVIRQADGNYSNQLSSGFAAKVNYEAIKAY